MLSNTNTGRDWEWEIKGKTNWLGTSLFEIWLYRHLIVGLVRRDFLLSYQQTILGPLWVLLQPLMTLVTYVLVFGKLVGISTQGAPPVLFYLAGIILWNLFNDSLTSTSSVFRDNAHIFSKVYFPRLVMPLAQMSAQLLRFIIQLLLLLLLAGYYWVFTKWPVPTALQLGLALVVVILTAALSLALGLIFSVLTGKYRDITYVVGLGVRLLMFLTPVIYPISYVTEQWRWIVELNPLTSLFELFRFCLLNNGTVTTSQVLYSGIVTLLLLTMALLVFNKTGDKLIDVI